MQTEPATDMAVLTAPFAENELKSRPVPGVGVKRYVPGAAVVSRVLAATGNMHEWQIVKIEHLDAIMITKWDAKKRATVEAVRPAHWICHGRLALPGLGSKDDIGSAVDDSEEGAKSAATDAFKRCAKQFGVALHIDDEPAVPERRRRAPGPDVSRETQQAADSDTADNGHNPDSSTGPITAMQTDAIKNMCKRKNLSANAMAQSLFGTTAQNLTEAQAASLIREIGKQGNVAAAG